MRHPSVALVLMFLVAACGGRTAEPPADERETAGMADVTVEFVRPADGDTVDATFAVRMAVSGVELQPAGTLEPGTGHLHILVDTAFVEPGQVIPADDRHLHFGDASVETELTLEPGEHLLRLQFADGAHVALEGVQYRDEIRVVVR